MNIRNFIIILVLVPLLLIIGAAVYFLGPWQDDGEKKAEESTLRVLVSEPVISPILSFDGEKIWYMTQAGKMFRLPLPQSLPQGEGKEKDSPPSMGGDKGRVEAEEYLLPQPLEGVVNVIWPLSGDDFLVEQASQKGANQFGLYDGTTRTFNYLNPQIRKTRFQGNPEKIVYEFDGALRELKVADKNGDNFRTVALLKRADYEIVSSPVKDEVVLFGTDALEQSYLILVDLETGKFTDIDQKDFYKNAIFSPDGTKLAVFRSPSSPSMGEDRGEGGLIIYDLVSGSTLKIGGEGGLLIQDFAWSADGKAIILADQRGIFRHELATLQVTQIYLFQDHQTYLPDTLILHPQKNLLFFVDKNDRHLYQVSF